MRGINIFASVWLIALEWAASVECSQDVLFQTTAKEFRPKFRYWLPDASVSPDVVADDVASIASVGAGLEFLPYYLYGLSDPNATNVPTPTDWNIYGFGTPAFISVFEAALQSANESNILIDFALGSNQGQGVPAIPGSPGLAVELLIGNTSVSSGEHVTIEVPPPQQPSQRIVSGLGFQHPLEQFGSPNLIAVTAFKVTSTYDSVDHIPLQNSTVTVPTVALDDSSYVDLTAQVQNGRLDWNVPTENSTWRIFSFWEQYTNQRSNTGGINATTVIGNGSWTVDHFSSTGAKVTTDFWDQYILSNETVADLLQEVGKYAWEDSMEILASLYWTPNFLQKFEKSRGYSLVKYLPLLYTVTNSWNGLLVPYPEQFQFGELTGANTSIHTLDYRTTLNEGYQDYIRHFTNWSHSKGFEYSNQPAYNLPLEMLSDIPLVDGPECESLGWADDVDAYRQFSGPAHLVSNPVISNELGAVNTAAYSLHVPELLFRVKRAFSGGITTVVLHGSPYSGNYPNTTWPGYTTFGYSYTDMWNRIQPCWQHLTDALKYIGRNQYVLQQGVPKIDLAFYLYEAPYTTLHQYSSTNLDGIGYTFDYLGPSNILSPQLTIDAKSLATKGPAYKALIFALDRLRSSTENIIPLEGLEKVKLFAKSGVPLVFVGAPPQMAPDVARNRSDFDALLQEILAEPSVYKVATIDDLPRVLSEAEVHPRLALNCTQGPVYNVWRSNPQEQTDFIFLYNDQTTATRCVVDVNLQEPSTPYIYDAWTGEQAPLLQYVQDDSKIVLPLHLEANETRIIALRYGSDPGLAKCAISNSTGALDSIKVDNNGTVLASLLGPATLSSASGKTWNFTASPPPPSELSQWELSIEDWHAGEDRFDVQTAITIHNFSLPSLVPWSDLGPGMDAVSGIGHYTTRFSVPEQTDQAQLSSVGAKIHFGNITHTARAFLDGQQLQPIDPAHSTVDISHLIQPGQSYDLKVDVTSTLFNRIKATANTTMIWGTIAAEAQPLYARLPAQRYGLLSPISIEWSQIYRLADNSCY